jgi:hypothetical protein
MKKLVFLGLTAALVNPIVGTAATYQISVDDYQLDSESGYVNTRYHNPAAGYVKNFSAMYSDESNVQRLKSSMTLLDAFPADVNGAAGEGGVHTINGLADGIWMVLNNGGGPKHGSSGQFAILYGDANNGRLTAYEYDGNGDEWSINKADGLIQSFENAFSVDNSVDGARTFNFDIDVTGINSHTPTTPNAEGKAWEGVQFGEEIGIWFHPFISLTPPTYNDDGTIADLGVGYSDVDFDQYVGWFDTDESSVDGDVPFLPTEPVVIPDVPVPGAIWLFASALLGGLGLQRKRKAGMSAA